MNWTLFTIRKQSAALFLTVIISLTGPFSLVPGLIPDATAAPSRDKRQIKKLKKQNRGLRRNVVSLKRQLAIARRPPPAFMEMVKVGNAGNAADQDFGDGQIGAVPYQYKIGKYEVAPPQTRQDRRPDKNSLKKQIPIS